MIDNSPYLYHWQVGVLPSTGNSITNTWGSSYQSLVITHVKKQWPEEADDVPEALD